MNEPAPLLQAQHITRRDPQGNKLLDDVSLQVCAGERWGIIGPTGSGKTLLLRSLALLDPIDQGEILWKGLPLGNESIPVFRRQVLYLHQRPHLLQGDVSTNLLAPLDFQANSHLHEPVNDWQRLLAGLNLDQTFLKKDAAELSGGEAQLVAALRGIQLSPRILLLDEPTAALDRQAALALEGLIDNWFDSAEPATSIVWVSHNAGQIQRVSHKILRLAAGRIQPN